MYKLLEKVLAKRLKNVVGKIVLVYLHAFVEDRQFLDAVLIINDALDSRLKSPNSGAICNLDIGKDDGHVNWNFLLTMLDKMDFDHKWVRWIKWYISTTKFSILVNSVLFSFFESSRDLR